MIARHATALLLVTVMAAGCVAAPDTPDTSSDATLTVIAMLDPISDLVQQIGGARVEVRSLVPSGSDAHTYAPRPRDALRLSQADMYVDVGLGLNDAALNLANANMSDESRIVLIGEALPRAQLIHDHDDGRGNFGPNPHIWTSVANVQAAVPVIRDALIAVDPAGIDLYSANSDMVLASLDDLDQTIRGAVATIPQNQRALVTFHDAWTYFARDYDLTYAVAVQGRNYADPSALAVRNLIDQIDMLGVVAVFGSAEFPSDVLAVIAEETGATYITGLADDMFPAELSDEPSFQALMRYNARVIIGGLGGDTALLD
ncbi:MAG: metal ABC transporter substrate-binding protein [Nitriliruptoraceae bacterium]